MSKIITVYEQSREADPGINIALLAEYGKENIEISIGDLVYGDISKSEALNMAQSIISYYEE